jgi:hypothetical protein
MGIAYGAMLAYLVPSLRNWWFMPTQLVASHVPPQLEMEKAFFR